MTLASFTMRRRIIAILLVLLIAAGLVLWWMTRVPPGWYEPPDHTSAHVQELADRAEYRLVQEAQKPRAVEENHWTLRIREEHINAWLAARLRKWIAHQGGEWPDQLGTPQVRIEQDGVALALPLVNEGISHFLVITIKPRIEDDSLKLEVHRVALGRIALPGEPLANFMEQLAEAAPDAVAQPQIRTLIELLEQRERIDPIIELANDQTIRIREIHLGEGMVDIAAQTINGAEQADKR